MELIHKYFTDLSTTQIAQFEQLDILYKNWNAKINLISRKDIDNLYERHILHSLALAAIMPDLKSGTEIIDLGTGGGFPGVPLAVLYPNVHFHLIDGTGKKIMVVNEIVQALGLKNVTAKQVRAEEWKGNKVDFVVTRAVAQLDKLILWTKPLLKQQQSHSYPNGLFAWKGGKIHEEMKAVEDNEYMELFPLIEIFEETYFEEKYLLYVQG